LSDHDNQRSVQYEAMFPWEIERAIAGFPLCYVPLGVLEWHGEHAAVGLDGIKAHAICVRAARQSGGVVIPTLWWGTDWREELDDGSYLTGGIERGERYHVPGSMFWIRPETHLNLMLDIYEAMRRRGFRAIVVLAGHWSRSDYLPTLRQSGERFLSQNPEMRWALHTDQELAGTLHYPHEHAAGGETSILMAVRPELVNLKMTFETSRSLQPWYERAREHIERRKTTPNRYIGVLTGVENGSNDPESTSSAARGERLLTAISSELARRAAGLLDGA
jgi:creatinine amidohydrolase